jgi:hypothetical protein
MEKRTITLDVDKFKEILLYSWHLIPKDKQAELVSLGIYPKPTITQKLTASTHVRRVHIFLK